MEHSFAAQIRRERTETANDAAADASASASSGTYDTPLDMSSLEGRIAAYNAAMEGGKQAVGVWTTRAIAEQPEQEQQRAPESFIAMVLAERQRHQQGRDGWALGR